MSREAIGRRVHGHVDTMADSPSPSNSEPDDGGDGHDGTIAVDLEGMAQAHEPAVRRRRGKGDGELPADLNGRGQQLEPGQGEKG
jgi:hypothetical protein